MNDTNQGIYALEEGFQKNYWKETKKEWTNFWFKRRRWSRLSKRIL